MYILNSIAPIFLLIILGKLITKSPLFPEAFFTGLTRFVFWIALPAFLINSTSSQPFQTEAVAATFLLTATAIILTLIIAWITARAMKLPSKQAGSFIQGAFRGNNAFIGLPIMIYTLREVEPNAEAIAVLILGPMIILFNLLSVLTLIHHGGEHKSFGESLRTVVINTFKNPLIIACLIGMVLQAAGIKLPIFLTRSLAALGSASLPMALISIGAGISFVRLSGAASPSLISSLLKLVLSPLLGLLLAPLFGLTEVERTIAVIALACPTAVSAYVMASAMNNDTALAGRIVALSTLISALTLPLMIALGEFL